MEVDDERVRVPVVEVAEEVLVQVDQVAVVRESSGVRDGWRVLRQADRALEVEVALLPAISALRFPEAARLAPQKKALGLASCASSPSGRCFPDVSQLICHGCKMRCEPLARVF